MSARYRTLTVLLLDDMCLEEATFLCGAIARLRGVAEAKPGAPTDVCDYIAGQQAKRDLLAKIGALLAP